MYGNCVYLIEDLFGAPTVCASRSCDRVVGEPLAALGVSDGDISFLRRNLLDFSLSPILLLAGGRPAVVLSSFWRSSGLFELVTLDVSPGAALSLVNGGALGGALLAPSFEGVLPKLRISPTERTSFLDVCRHARALGELSSQLPECDCRREAILYERFLRESAAFFGVEIELFGELPQGVAKNCDRSIMAAFLTLSLLCVRDGARTRSGRFSFSSDGDRLIASFEAEWLTELGSLSSLGRLFDRLQPYSSLERRGDRVCAELSCCRAELSLLGLKHEP